jgi:two-component system chemotaxis response regulator CheB
MACILGDLERTRKASTFVAQCRTARASPPIEDLVPPSIDVLFRSAAVTFGTRVLGILLRGDLYDGVAGLPAMLHPRELSVVAKAAAMDGPADGAEREREDA